MNPILILKLLLYLFAHSPVCNHSLAAVASTTQLCVVALLTPFGLHTLYWAMVTSSHPLLGKYKISLTLRCIVLNSGHGLFGISAGCLPWAEFQSLLMMLIGLQVSLWHSQFHSPVILENVALCMCSRTLSLELIYRWPPFLAPTILYTSYLSGTLTLDFYLFHLPKTLVSAQQDLLLCLDSSSLCHRWEFTSLVRGRAVMGLTSWVSFLLVITV